MEQQPSKCEHYWKIDPPKGSWSLAICSKCDKIDAFLNWNPHPNNKVCIKDKREFLKSRGIKYWETYSIEVKKEVIQAASQFGIHEAARLFDIPISTVGLWAKGRSVYIKNADKYPNTFKMFALGHYLKERNFKKVSRKLGVPRSTLQSWARKSLNRPH